MSLTTEPRNTRLTLRPYSAEDFKKPNLRALVMLEIHRGAENEGRWKFDADAVRQICAQLPEELRERIVSQFLAFGRTYRNIKVLRKKCSNNGLNRLLRRLDNSLFEACGKAPIWTGDLV
jgi:hypothetical protein